MVAPFTRNATQKMIACGLALRGLAKNPASALWSFARSLHHAKKVALLHDHALILNFWRCQKLWYLIRDPLKNA